MSTPTPGGTAPDPAAAQLRQIKFILLGVVALLVVGGGAFLFTQMGGNDGDAAAARSGDDAPTDPNQTCITAVRELLDQEDSIYEYDDLVVEAYDAGFYDAIGDSSYLKDFDAEIERIQTARDATKQAVAEEGAACEEAIENDQVSQACETAMQDSLAFDLALNEQSDSLQSAVGYGQGATEDLVGAPGRDAAEEATGEAKALAQAVLSEAEEALVACEASA